MLIALLEEVRLRAATKPRPICDTAETGHGLASTLHFE